jgi:hypothetical protein
MDKIVGYLEVYTDDRKEYLFPLKVQSYRRTSTRLIEVSERPFVAGTVGYVAVWIEPLRFVLDALPKPNIPLSIPASINRNWVEFLGEMKAWECSVESAMKELA